MLHRYKIEKIRTNLLLYVDNEIRKNTTNIDFQINSKSTRDSLNDECLVFIKNDNYSSYSLNSNKSNKAVSSSSLSNVTKSPIIDLSRTIEKSLDINKKDVSRDRSSTIINSPHHDILGAPEMKKKVLLIKSKVKNDEDLIFKSYKKLKCLVNSLKFSRVLKNSVRSSMSIARVSIEESKFMNERKGNVFRTLNQKDMSHGNILKNRIDFVDSYKLIKEELNENFLKKLTEDIGNKRNSDFQQELKEDSSTTSISPISKKVMNKERNNEINDKLNFSLSIRNMDFENSKDESPIVKLREEDDSVSDSDSFINDQSGEFSISLKKCENSKK